MDGLTENTKGDNIRALALAKEYYVQYVHGTMYGSISIHHDYLLRIGFLTWQANTCHAVTHVTPKLKNVNHMRFGCDIFYDISYMTDSLMTVKVEP